MYYISYNMNLYLIIKNIIANKQLKIKTIKE